MDSIVGLGNRITYDFVAPGAIKSHTSLDNIVILENGIAYEIVYDFRRDRTTVHMQLQTKDLGKSEITKMAYHNTIV